MPTRQLTHQTHPQPPLPTWRTRAKLPPEGTEAVPWSSWCQQDACHLFLDLQWSVLCSPPQRWPEPSASEVMILWLLS